MILTCPNCATRYFVADEALGAGGDGRTVRCTSCGNSWKASAEPPLELTLAPEGAVGREPLRAEPAAADLSGVQIPRQFRARAEEQKRAREAAAAGAVWAAIAGVFVALLIGAVVFRLEVVRAFPKAASVYAGVGLPVNLVGLTIEKVKAAPSLSGGRAGLDVSGMVRNIRDHPVAAPALNVALLDKAGHRLSTQIARMPDTVVPAGASRPFAVTVLDPPSPANNVEVTFVLDSHGRPPLLPRAKPALQAAATAPRLRPAEAAPPPVLAQPLPAAEAATEGPPETGPVTAPAAPDAKPLPKGDPYALKHQGD